MIGTNGEKEGGERNTDRQIDIQTDRESGKSVLATLFND